MTLRGKTEALSPYGVKKSPCAAFTFETAVFQHSAGGAPLTLIVETGNDGASWQAVKTSPDMLSPGSYFLTVDVIPGLWARLRYSFTYGPLEGVPMTTQFFCRRPDRERRGR